MVKTHTWPVTIGAQSNDLCQWIVANGGWAALTTSNVLYIIDVRLGLQNPGWSVTTTQVLGIIDYRLNNCPSGNTNTGCEFIC